MNRQELTDRLLAYAQTDTLLFYVPYPAPLTARQSEKWGAVIRRFNEKGADLQATLTLTPAPFGEKSQQLIRTKLAEFDDKSLQWFGDLAGAYRSVLLAFAVCDGELSEDEAFDLSNLEELYQNELWQTDEEALKARQIRHDAAKTALRHIQG